MPAAAAVAYGKFTFRRAVGCVVPVPGGDAVVACLVLAMCEGGPRLFPPMYDASCRPGDVPASCFVRCFPAEVWDHALRWAYFLPWFATAWMASVVAAASRYLPPGLSGPGPGSR